MIRLDRATRSVVVLCSCGWRDVTTTTWAAYTAAQQHELVAHPGVDTARRAEAEAIRRANRS